MSNESKFQFRFRVINFNENTSFHWIALPYEIEDVFKNSQEMRQYYNIMIKPYLQGEAQGHGKNNHCWRIS